MRTLIFTLLLAIVSTLHAEDPWKAGTIVSTQEIETKGLGAFFAADTINDGVFMRMQGKSIPAGCEISRKSLRYLRVLHADGKGNTRRGEIVCNAAIADDLVDIFQQLFKARYPIERISLIDNYNANDEASMAANNTSAFCYRRIAGSQKLSRHSLGMAIDINPLYNPCVKIRKNGQRTVQPANARQWCNRNRNFSYKISRGDLCCRLFKQHGFSWGGDWKTTKDYQHFEK